jgi:hypothetical protein
MEMAAKASATLGTSVEGMIDAGSRGSLLPLAPGSMISGRSLPGLQPGALALRDADGASYLEALANVERVIDEWIETAQELG